MEAFFVAYVLVHGLSVLLSLGIFVYLIQLAKKTQINLLYILSLTALLWAVTNSLVLLPSFLSSNLLQRQTILGWKLNANWDLLDVIAAASIVSTISIYAFVTLFFDGFKGNFSIHRTTTVAIIISSIVTMVLASFLTSPFLISNYVYVGGILVIIWSDVSWFMMMPEFFLLAYWALKDLWIAKKYAIDQLQLKQLKLMQVAMFITILFGPLLSAGGDAINEGGNSVLGSWIAEIFGYGTISFGYFLVVLAYMGGKRIAFLSPARLNRLLVINPGGIVIFRHNFLIKDESEVIDDLLSGALTAIQAIMKESLGNAAQIHEIVLDNYVVSVEVDESLGYLLISQTSSRFVRKALQTFKQIFQNYSEDYETGNPSSSIRSNLLTELNICFGLAT